MRVFKARLWRAAGMATIAGIGLAACGPGEGGEAGGDAAAPVVGEAGEAGSEAGAAGGEAGEAGGGEGGEAGEAGAADAYAGVAGPERRLVRLHHLEGFLLIADRVAREGDAASAAILLQQGLLEVADPAAREFGGVDLGALKAAATAPGGAGLAQALKAGLDQLQAQQDALGGATPETVRRMLALTRGLYGEVVIDGGVDPIEYQHSLGAALAASAALDDLARRASGDEATRAKAAQAQMRTLLGLWPTTRAPDAPTPPGQLIAQTSRVELALPR